MRKKDTAATEINTGKGHPHDSAYPNHSLRGSKSCARFIDVVGELACVHDCVNTQAGLRVRAIVVPINFL